MSNIADTWQVRQVEESPRQDMDEFTMFKILEGSTMDNMGCEFVTIKKGEVLQPHVHKKSHSIILVIGGNGFALLDDVKYPIKTHSVINIPPGVVHGLESGDENLQVYGFQTPGIISQDNVADIYYSEDGRQGTVTKVHDHQSTRSPEYKTL